MTFGIVLPVGCLLFDPFVFRSSWLGGPAFGRYAVAAYLTSALGVASLSWWLLTRKFPAFSAGLLAGGAVFAALTGLALLPLSLFGLFLGIGVLGFIPFVTAVVFGTRVVQVVCGPLACRQPVGWVTVMALGLGAEVRSVVGVAVSGRRVRARADI